MTSKRTPGIGAARMRAMLGDRSLWTGLGLGAAVLAVAFLFGVRIPASVDRAEGQVLSASTVHTTTGNRPVFVVQTADGHRYHVGTGHLEPWMAEGAEVCLNVQTDRFTGRISARFAGAAPCAPLG